jgi:hypothetical protein
MERSLPGIGERFIDVGAALQQELAKPPVSMERSPIQTEICAQRLQRFAVRKKKPDRAHVAKIGAGLEERHAVPVSIGSR